MKQNVLVPLFAVVIASVIGRSEAVPCYRCNYTDWPEVYGPSGQSNCAEPVNASASPRCSSQYCTWMLSNVTDERDTSMSFVQRECSDDSYRELIKCGMSSETTNCTSYNYGGNSCYYTQAVLRNGYRVKTIICFCNTDYCNGDLLYARLPNAMSVLKPFAGMWFALLVALAIMSDHLALPCQQR